MHFADSIVIFLLALILFGPKKLPEVARQVGKLMMEFRRASNEFKSQIDDELRAMEQQDRQKKLEATAAQTPALTAPENTSAESTESYSRPESARTTLLSEKRFVPTSTSWESCWTKKRTHPSKRGRP